MVIELHDVASGVKISETHVEAATMMLALTGYARQECETKLSDRLDLVGKVRETRSVPMPRRSFLTADDVLQHFDETGLAADGWEISCDGLRRQQPDFSRHYYTVTRWI